MDDNFDFDNIGKRMPYSTPDDFFKNMEEQVMDAVENFEPAAPRTAGSKWRTAFKPQWKRIVAATVAAAAIVLVASFFVKPQQAEDSLPDVEQAFAQLMPEDQDYLLNIYQDDIFINDYN